MGITNTLLTIRNPQNPKKSYTGEFLVDTGAQYTVLPQAVWKRLQLRPDRKQKFSLADGAIIERAVGSAFVEFQGIKSATPVVLGEKKDTSILGVVTLETLGLSINPFTRELYPAKLML